MKIAIIENTHACLDTTDEGELKLYDYDHRTNDIGKLMFTDIHRA